MGDWRLFEGDWKCHDAADSKLSPSDRPFEARKELGELKEGIVCDVRFVKEAAIGTLSIATLPVINSGSAPQADPCVVRQQRDQSISEGIEGLICQGKHLSIPVFGVGSVESFFVYRNSNQTTAF